MSGSKPARSHDSVGFQGHGKFCLNLETWDNETCLSSIALRDGGKLEPSAPPLPREMPSYLTGVAT